MAKSALLIRIILADAPDSATVRPIGGWKVVSDW